MTGVADEQVRRSRAIQKQTGRSFYLATRLLPERVRERTHVLYAFFRICDEVVDDYTDDGDGDEKHEELDRLCAQALGDEEPEGPVVAAFTEVREEYGIPEDEVVEFIDAMKTDISKTRYEDFGEVRDYMRGSASSVGNMMTCIMDVEDYETAKPHAEALGEAFQMTNFLRDVREDIEKRGRIYLPLETLRAHDAVEDVESLEPTDGFREAMKHEMERTEELYREGVAGIRHLPDDCQFGVLLASVVYAEYHRKIRADDYDVLTSSVSLSRRRILSLYARTRLAWARDSDPESVFYDVSAVPAPEPVASDGTVSRLRKAVSVAFGDD